MKRAELSEERSGRNASRRSAMKTAIKKFEETPGGDRANLETAFTKATRLVDKAAAKGIPAPQHQGPEKIPVGQKAPV